MNGAGWTISSGKDINDGWEIVGTGLTNGPERAVLLRPRPFTVSVERTGTGAGSVAGPASIACGDTMRGALRAGDEADTPGASAEGSRFVRWQGACTGTKAVCTRAVDGALAVRAVFTRVPQPCRCAAISTTASLRGTERLAGGGTRVRLAIDWRMRCATGIDGRCEGRLLIEAARPGVRLLSPAGGSVRCSGACGQTGERVHSGRSEATIEVSAPSSGHATVALLVRKFCLTGGRLREVGVDRIELTLVPPG